MTKYLFVGDKPSSKNRDPNVPFFGTKSYGTLVQWILKLDINIFEVTTTNSDMPFRNMHSIYNIHLNEKHPTIPVVALGNNAAKALDKEGVKNYYKLPHPSGRNRKLNDKAYVEEQLKLCKQWLKEFKWQK